MPTLATYENCTGCGACAFRCSKQCISMNSDITGGKYPVIDASKCIECGSCEKACPALHEICSNAPIEAYAAWHNDAEQRRTSASGGIATAIYKYCIENGHYVIGASQNEDWTVTHKIVDNVDSIAQFKNSRYVFSEPYTIYSEVKQLLAKGESVLMIGLPCQIAAMRKLFPNHRNLTLIDIVCHGIMPASYLQQHIACLEASLNKKAARMSFRAPEKGTAKYFFTLYDENNNIFYSKRSADGDTYNIAFHRSIAYRENCYHCQYAKPQRVSDLTLGDYHGLGLKAPANFDDNNVSVILVNTQKGKNLIDQITKKGIIHVNNRPVDEPIEGDAQLRRPSPKPEQRRDFETLIKKNTGNFEKTIQSVFLKARNRDKRRAMLKLPRRIACKLFKLVFNK